MKHMLRLLALLTLFAIPSGANAATCYWVGGSGTWSSTSNANWASATGGAGGSCAAVGGQGPKNLADLAVFDAHASGINGGTVVVSADVNGLTINSITANAMVGTLDFATNNPSMTFANAFSSNGSGTRSINCGTGTFTFSAAATVWDASGTGITLSCASATFVINNTAAGGAQNFNGGTAKSYGTLIVNGRTTGTIAALLGTTSVTFNTLTLNGPVTFTPVATPTPTIVTGALNLTGTSSGLVLINGSANAGTLSPMTLTGAAINASWAAIRGTTITGGPIAGTAIFDLGNAAGSVTANPPATGGAGGSGGIIGG